MKLESVHQHWHWHLYFWVLQNLLNKLSFEITVSASASEYLFLLLQNIPNEASSQIFIIASAYLLFIQQNFPNKITC